MSGTGGVASLKRAAALCAIQFVESGMVIGLGGGSTAAEAIAALAEGLRSGRFHDVVGVPCSKRGAAQATSLGIPLTDLRSGQMLDLTIDGADEIAPSLDLIKGGGGALLREKIIAQASRRLVIVADSSKLSPALGTNHALPVEVLPFGWLNQRGFLESLGCQARLRRDNRGRPFLTDQRNFVLDCHFGPIASPYDLACRLEHRAGVIEHGLFLGMATDLVVAGPDGVRHRRLESARSQ